MKNLFKLLAVLCLLVIVWRVYPIFQTWGNDIRALVLAEDGIGLLSISPRRRMVNMVKISLKTQVWIPGGYGWYEAGSVDKLLSLEKKRDRWKLVAFYNFGFFPERMIEVSRVDDWGDLGGMADGLGLGNMLKWQLIGNDLLPRVQTLEGPKVDEVKMDEVAVRDLADGRLVNEEYRLSVINSSDRSGLANFMARRFEWSGMTVSDVTSADTITDTGCLLVAEPDFKKSWSYRTVLEPLGCELVADGVAGTDIVEVYLGKEWAKMLDYSSL